MPRIVLGPAAPNGSTVQIQGTDALGLVSISLSAPSTGGKVLFEVHFESAYSESPGVLRCMPVDLVIPSVVKMFEGKWTFSPEGIVAAGIFRWIYSVVR